MFYFYFTIHREAYIFNHLSRIQFGNQHAFHFFSIGCNGFCGEGPKGNGAQYTDFDTFFACKFHCFLSDTGHRTEGDNQVIGIFTIDFFETYFVFFNQFVFSLEADVILFHLFRFQFQRSNDIGLASVYSAGSSPRALLDNFCICTAGLLRRQYNLFHHLTDNTVGKNDSRVAIFEGKIKGQSNEISHFLYGSGSQSDQTVVTVTSTLDSLEVVCLTGLDGSQSGAAAHYVYNQTG